MEKEYMKKIYLLIDSGAFFAYHNEFGYLNKNILIDFFKQHKIKLHILELSNIETLLKLKNAIVFTVSSQKPYHKKLIEDLYEFLEANNNILIPSKHIIKAHDNKGYQELYKRLIGIDSLKYLYVNHDILNYEDVKKIGYPIVLKKLAGSGSRGVKLIRNENELKKEITRIKKSFDIRFLIYLKEYIKNLFLHKNNKDKMDYFKDYDNFVLQEFIPNLEHDYKVLIFFDKLYVLKRNIKDGDFRASGSGDFEFVDVEHALLDYATTIFQVFDEPFMSLDICCHEENYYLIEYQWIHFGQYTQVYSTGYYQKKDSKWHFVAESVSLEYDIAYALFNYLKTHLLV